MTIAVHVVAAFPLSVSPPLLTFHLRNTYNTDFIHVSSNPQHPYPPASRLLPTATPTRNAHFQRTDYSRVIEKSRRSGKV